MIEKLQEKLVEIKQSKAAKMGANIGWDLEGENRSKTFFKNDWKIKYAKLHSFWTLYSAKLLIKKRNIPVTLRTFLNQLKIFWKH